jgi:hypothetical protein
MSFRLLSLKRDLYSDSFQPCGESAVYAVDEFGYICRKVRCGQCKQVQNELIFLSELRDQWRKSTSKVAVESQIRKTKIVKNTSSQNISPRRKTDIY